MARRRLMTDLSDAVTLSKYRPRHRVRLVTAASLFDGHDASINVMRRLLQAMGAEVIHLGHNRSVDEVVSAALNEDVQGIAVSSYQGGHLEYFKYMLDRLRAQGAGHIRLFGGGGGVIIASEIAELQAYGVTRIYSPEDGQRMGLAGMCGEILMHCDTDLSVLAPTSIAALRDPDLGRRWRALSQAITALESGTADSSLRTAIGQAADAASVPVLGVTGTGGAGKSSLADEMVRRLRLDQGDRLTVAIVSIDPSRRRTGGALLGDRIRMNAIGPWQDGPRVYMRSLATRQTGSEISAALPAAIAACKAAGFDLVLVETSGIGQGDAAIVPLVDLSLYVMTPEYGAASQLEKIEMLDFADFIAINKFDRSGAQDALREVCKQVQRNRGEFAKAPADMPVYGTIAARFNDDGVTALYQAIVPRLAAVGLKLTPGRLARVSARTSTHRTPIIPPSRNRYLAEIAQTVRAHKRGAREQSRLARERQQLSAARELLAAGTAAGAPDPQLAPALTLLASLIEDRAAQLDPASLDLLADWPQLRLAYQGEEFVQQVRGHELRTRASTTSLSGLRIPKVALPAFEDDGELLRWLLLENVPGRFPYTAGVFEFKREEEEATRMFAGEGDAFRTNRRFHMISQGMPAKRLSTAFDSVTLYGHDPDVRPDIYGKIGNSGVSIATLDDIEVLYSGFDLTAPDTSVSMTINGPAPTILAMFLNCAIDQKLDLFRAEQGREPDPQEAGQIRQRVLANVRGTVQADILKEDQGQNTCIFSTEFSLKVMGDIQQYFVRNQVRNFYSVSISGYHIAEAGANPISQLAFTLANGFTYVEAYLAREMSVDEFAPNLSFFFSNGMDPEFTVLGRVARRIWAVAMRDRYGANERSQKLKYHCQTSGRSLHAQEIAFNDIRTTLQALIATYDNANSLHTNAYDEAITTPTEHSVRRAIAIQLIVNREWGLARNENPNQGSFIIEELTELVEEAVLKEFEALSERGGVLGAMELGYQRGKIQDESLHYETLKHSGAYPIVGVNTFRDPAAAPPGQSLALARSTEEEKRGQLDRLQDFQRRHAGAAGEWLQRLREAAIRNDNVFDVLMDAVRHCSLGQISNALFEVGGQYRRSM
jgi:methylmalonyl-CoA mutase